MTWTNIEDACRAACAQVGVDYRTVPHDGRFHVADITDDPRGKNDGRIQITPDGQRVQVFNNKSGERAQLFLNSDKSRPMSATDKTRIAQEQRQREAERAAEHNRKAAIARREYRKAQAWPFELTGYMQRKQLPSAHCAKRGRFDRRVRCVDGVVRRLVVDDVLLAPVLDRFERIRNIQYIFDQAPPELGRDKTFIAGGELAGCYCRIGAPSATVFLTEGFADAVCLHADTACRVYVAFSAGNLPAVALIVRELYPEASIVVCQDNDAVGIQKANEAAAHVDGTVYAPPFGKDYNDSYIEQMRLERERG